MYFGEAIQHFVNDIGCYYTKFVYDIDSEYSDNELQSFGFFLQGPPEQQQQVAYPKGENVL